MTERQLSRARSLAYFTVGYNLVEGVVSVAFGAKDESLSLFGFGLDSFIECASAFVVLWRVRRESATGSVESRERPAVRAIGGLFLVLAVVVAAGSILRLARVQHPDTALPGIVISLASLSFMVFLYRAKMRLAREAGSRTLRSDAICSLACVWLSLVLLVGSALYAALGIWWADSVSALLIAGLIAREGWEGVSEPDGCSCGSDCQSE